MQETETYVFNIGFAKCGTNSLCSALNILGINTIHYQIPNQNILIEKLIKKNIKFGRKIFHSLDNQYFGYSDFSGLHYYTLLDRDYPNSKFILTTRNIDDYITSRVNHDAKYHHEILKTKAKISSKQQKLRENFINNTQKLKKYFKDKPDQYLELKICEGEGWEKLCPFLNLAIPKMQFPHLNKSF